MAPAAIPYYTDFSDGSDQYWLLNNANCHNQWVIGSIDASASGLFITSNGITPGYATNSRSVVSAEKLFVVGDATELTISFDVNIGGENEFDYLKVFFAPSDSSYPATSSVFFPDYSSEEYSTHAVNFSDYLQYSAFPSYPYKFNLTNDSTVQVSVTMPNPNAMPSDTSTAKLVFLWKNDNSDGTQPGAIIYNVSVASLTAPCEVPTGLHQVVISYNGELSNQVTWDNNANVSQWNVQYKIEGSDWIMETVTENQFSIPAQHFHYNTDYPVRVQAVCDDGNTSEWSAPITMMGLLETLSDGFSRVRQRQQRDRAYDPRAGTVFGLRFMDRRLQELAGVSLSRARKDGQKKKGAVSAPSEVGQR